MNNFLKISLKMSASVLVIGSLATISHASDVSTFAPELTETKPVNVKAYQAEEAHYLKTAQKLMNAKTQSEYDALRAELTQSALTTVEMAENGAQAELMKSTHAPRKSMFSRLKSKIFGKSKSKHHKALAPDVEEINVLSLDGGGVRGIGTLAMLGMLEMKTGKKTYELFDRIYGTSTGGLMAVMLASGMSATDVLDVYLDRMGQIFSRTWADALTNPLGICKANYNPAGLESLIQELMPNKKLSDCMVPVAVTTVDAKTGSVILLSSEDEDTKDVTILEAGRATSAAPTYFPQKEVHTKTRTFMGMDGGVAVNNPSLEAYNHTKDVFGDQKVSIKMLSLGTGAENLIQLNENAGKLGFGSPGNIPGFFMALKAKEIEDKMNRLDEKRKVKFDRFQFDLPFAIDLADTGENAKALLLKQAWARANASDFSEYLQGRVAAERLAAEQPSAVKTQTAIAA